MILFVALLFAAPPPAAAQTWGLPPAPLCKFASDHDISWVPVGAAIRWREYSDMPSGTFGCRGVNHDNRPGDDADTVDIDFNLLGNRDSAHKLILTVENNYSTWFDSGRRLIPLLEGFFRVTGRELPGNIRACVAKKCSGFVRTTMGTLTLKYKEDAPTRRGDGVYRSAFEYVLTFDFLAPPASTTGPIESVPSNATLVATLLARAEDGVLPGDVVQLFGLEPTVKSIKAKLVVVDNDPIFNVFGKSLAPGTDDVIFVRVTPAAASFYLTDTSLKLRVTAVDTGGGLRLIVNEEAAAGYAEVLKFWQARVR
jgi:hypothetical protein